MVHLSPLPRLREIRDEERRLERCIESLRPERDQLIRRAAAEKRYSQRTIAGSTGLSRSRIHQIVSSD